jgi:Cft2 family RNA processing exonuclease
MFKISLGNGIVAKFGGQTILLDPRVSDFISFVSHAHADHSPFGFVKKPYCTEETYALIKLRDPYFEANVVRENERIKFDNFSARLINSGHVLGAAQVLIEADGQTILYTGDFKLSENLTCKPIRKEQADILITESTYGTPEYVFPSVTTVREQIIKWVKNQLKDDYAIDIGGYQIGKAQEAIKLLNDNDITPKVSETIRRYSDVYKKFGVKLDFVKPEDKSKVLIKPMHLLNATNGRDGKKVKTCALTGWSVDGGKLGGRADANTGFPLSDHCDFNQIMEYVKIVEPKQVYCVHGYTQELAKEIRKRFKIPAKTLDVAQGISGQRLLIDF